VHPAQCTGRLELVEVAAHRLGRDVEQAGQLDDAHTTVGLQQSFDLLLTLRCVHLRSFLGIPTHYNT
jgi:hypothetical protein